MSRSARLGVVAVIVVAIAAAVAAGTLASNKPKGKHISGAKAFILPSANVCVSGHKLTFRLRKLPHVKWRSVTVSVNGRHFKTIKLHRTLRVTLRGLPSRAFVLRLTAHTSDRRTATASRRYNPCARKSAHLLTVVVAGSGSVSGSGISCPSSCSHSYAAGSTVTLTASAASGSRFSGWSGGGCSGTGTCTVTMSSDQSVTATFAVVTHTLSVVVAGSGSVSGSGISCPGTCSHSYAAGSTVTLTAASASGSSFSGWSGGGCSGTGTCTVTMSSDQTVTATFAVVTHTLSVVVAGSGSVAGSGISCPGTCSHSYAAGSMVTLTASAASGSSFSGWSGGACSGTGTCTVTMSSDQTVTAMFAVVTHTLSVVVAGSGSVTGTGISCPGTCSHSYTAGSMVTLSASPATGSSFSGWSGGGCSGTGTCTVTMSSDQTVTATFAGITHALTVVVAGSGSVTGTGISCPSTCSHSYAAGSTVTLTASAASGSSFSGWSGGGCSGTGTCTVTMSSDQTVTATFAANPVGPPSGSYSGGTSQSHSVLLYVSPDSTQLQDVTMDAVDLACAPSTPSPNPSPDKTFSIASVPIMPDGSFSGSATETAVLPNNAPVHITYTFSGQFTGASVAGSFVENLSYDGTTISCTSGTRTWSATWQSQGNQAVLAPPAGSYSSYGNLESQSHIVSLYVSPDSTQLQDVSIDAVNLACAPSTPSPSPSPDSSFSIASIPITGGSFSGSGAETGVIGNAPVHITYTFSGHFHGRSSSNYERIAGAFRETITYDGTTTYCTSNNQYWSATWQTQGNQAALAPPAGSYSSYGNLESQRHIVSLYVSPDSTQLQDVTIDAVDLACTPSTPTTNPSPDTSFSIASIPITDGSFSGSATETAVIPKTNDPVHITYTFSGHFHGRDSSSSNNERIAGSFRENITYDGTTISCTSNNQFWSATWQGQGNQAVLAPPAGSYSSYGNLESQSHIVSLYVSPDSTQLQDVTIDAVNLACAPSTPSPSPSPDSSFSIASIPITGGSFSGSGAETGVIGNAPVHITYTFSGHFHGQTSSNNERIAGSFRENITYDGTTTYCTSNNQFWSATWQSQGNQAVLAPPAGSYSSYGNLESQSHIVSLSVSSDSTQLQNVTIDAVNLACTPSTPSHNPSPDTSFSIASIPILPDGSFSGSITQTGLEGGAPVHFTYTFSGHFHGRNSSNKERIAGLFRENITYDGTTTFCTSNNQFWSATQQ